jgi:thiosulfate/3-mercaptopyruvate sulfurtransferase
MNPLIDARELSTALDRHVLVDCRFDLMDLESGQSAYLEGHIPGARYAHLERDLSSRPRPEQGRHPLPEPEALAERLGGWGISNHSSVVVYDAGSSAFAARLWWLLRWVGHTAVQVLDGGYQAWQSVGLPIERRKPDWAPAHFVAARPRLEWVATSTEIESRLESPDWGLVDARTEPRFRGEEEPIDPVAGHVPGALNYPFQRSLREDGRFLPTAELRERLLLTDRIAGNGELVAMCGSGVTACHVLLALAVAGLPDGRLYAGSWSEWIRDPERRIATGV